MLRILNCLLTVCVFVSCGSLEQYKKHDLKRKSYKNNFIWPVHGLKITSYYGWRSQIRMHNGIDLTGRIGTPIYAAEAGKVTNRGWINGFGYTIILKHNNSWSTIYAHLSKYYVKLGDHVKKGQLIGGMGRSGRATGPNLHFEILKKKVAVDPLLFLPPTKILNKIN